MAEFCHFHATFHAIAGEFGIVSFQLSPISVVHTYKVFLGHLSLRKPDPKTNTAPSKRKIYTLTLLAS